MKKKLLMLALLFGCFLFPQKAFGAENDTARHYDLEQDGGTCEPDETGTYHYILDGQMVKNGFLFDGTYTYYLQNDGTPMKDRLTYHPDGEHIIYFDGEGHEVFDKDVNVKRAIDGTEMNEHCYFGTYGYMFQDQTVFSYGIPSYYNAYGVRENDGWFRFADGNFGYARTDGSLLHNQFGYNPYGQYVFYHWNGQVARGLMTDGNYYYYMDENDGHLEGAWDAETKQEGALAGTARIAPGAYDEAILGDNYFTKNVKDNSFSNYIKQKNATKEEKHLFIYRKADGSCTDSETNGSGVYLTTRGIMVGSNKTDVENAYSFIDDQGNLAISDVTYAGESLNTLLTKPYMNLDACPEVKKVLQQAVSCDAYYTGTDFQDEEIDNNLTGLNWRMNGIRFYYDSNDTVIAIEYYWHHAANGM